MSLLIGLGSLLPPLPAGAADWDASTRVRMALEHDDNPSLAAGAGLAQTSTALGLAFDAGRRSETTQTRVAGELVLHHELRGSDDRRTDGHLSLAHSAAGERSSFALAANADADAADSAGFGSADVLLGGAARRTRGLSASWQQRLDERWTLQTTAAWAGTGYADGAGRDFREHSLSAQGSLALDERSSLSLTLAHSAYRRDDGGDASDSRSLRLGWSRRLSERATLSLGAGRWQSTRRLRLQALACPLPLEFCALGLVQPIVVPFEQQARSQGGSGSASAEWALGERSALAARASRDLASGGGGVQRTDAWTAALQHALDPQTDATLRWSRTQAQVPGETTSRARLDTLEARLGRALSPDLRIGIAAEHRRSTNAAGSAAGTRVTLTLEANGPALHR